MKRVSRKLSIGDVTFKTNVPAQVALFDTQSEVMSYDNGRLGYRFNPAALDAIEPGTYRVSSWRKHKISPIGHPWKYRQSIDIQGSPYGKVVDQASFGNTLPVTFSPERLGEEPGSRARAVAPLLGKLGYVLAQNKRITALPTPTTFQHAASQHGVSVRIFDGSGRINDVEYLQSFAEGHYPVAAGKENYYLHDISDDHATAMLLGGAPLRDALQGAAAYALEEGKTDVVPGAIDNYTSLLRLVVVDDGYTFDSIDQRVMKAPSAVAALHDNGQKMQLPAEMTNGVIEAAYDNARAWGVPVHTS